MTDTGVISVARAAIDPAHAHGLAIDRPDTGAAIDGYALDVVGWALARDAGATRIEMYSHAELVATTALKEQRPDIAQLFPSAAGASTSGYGTAISLLGLSGQFELVLAALLDNGTRLPIGAIYGQRRPLVTGYEPRFQPIVVTTIGRSGSTWLSYLLGHHPEIQSYRSFFVEPHSLWHWLHLLRLMADPRRYRPAMRGIAGAGGWTIAGDDPPLSALKLPDETVKDWLDGPAVEASAAVCQQRVDALQGRLAEEMDKRRARFFVEKLAPDFYPWIAWDVYPNAREIVLVRDPRDVFFSTLAYNAKRGWDGFGRENVDTDEVFARHMRGSGVALRRAFQGRSDRALLVRYEDLIQEPEVTLAAILRYLGLHYDLELVRQMLGAARESSARFHVHRTSPSPADSIGRWRREDNPSLLAACHEAFDDLLADFGYDTD